MHLHAGCRSLRLNWGPKGADVVSISSSVAINRYHSIYYFRQAASVPPLLYRYMYRRATIIRTTILSKRLSRHASDQKTPSTYNMS